MSPSFVLHQITQKPLLVLAICLTLLLTISAAAAESMAPKSLKPSSFFGLKKNTQSNFSNSSSVSSVSNSTIINPNFISQNSNSASSKASLASTMFTSGEDLYFKGKIGDSPIRMALTNKDNTWTGSYIYEKVSSEVIDLACQVKDNDFACQENTGGFVGTVDAQTTISGSWQNSDQTKKLPFDLLETDKFKLSDFLTKPENQKTYTNEYYPSLSLKYPESWQLETTTSPSNYKELRQREIVLTKNSTKLVLTMTPTFATGCTPETELQSLAKAGNVYRFQSGKNKYTYQTYAKGVLCGLDFKIQSNLKVAEYPDYQKYKEAGVVESFVRVELQSDSTAEIAEADQIMAKSTFFDSKD